MPRLKIDAEPTRLTIFQTPLAFPIADIEQVLKEKKPFILHCMPRDLKVMRERSPVWKRCALNGLII
jgi:hypothetical protein